ncbi:hypothetical protein [Desulfogranum marinum]|uniref:hypothetical protein n=2 Tax=Desulfogranum marinum TaxID=453220 RepID=UPI0019661269|nr:hypothetical protein [Desulfogranum marinum]
MTMTMLMNPHSGSVATEEEWREKFANSSPEEWGGENFEDADLTPVIFNSVGVWVEVD